MTALLPRPVRLKLPRGITAYWPLDASTCEFGSGQVRPLDVIGNNYGSDAKSPGKAGRPPYDGGGIGYNFNATTSTYLTTIGDPLQGKTGAGVNLTLAFWVNPATYSSSDGVGNGGRLFTFGTELTSLFEDGSSGTGLATGSIYVQDTFGAGGSTASAVPLGLWTHVAITFVSGAFTSLYINGVSVALTNTGNIGFSGSAHAGNLGCRDSAARIMNARLAHFMITSGTVLTAAEIADVYYSTFQSDEVLPALPAPTGAASGTLATTEAPDTAVFNGTIAVTGTLAATESPDTAAFSGSTVVSGTWASTEAADTAALSGNTVASGSFAVTEAQDVASFAGSGIVSGTFAATDTPDTAVLSGNAGTSGSLSATTSQDVAVFAGNFGIAGTLVSTEASDLAVFVGQFGIASGTLAANDNTDIAAFIGSATGAPSGSLAVTELPDNVVFLIDYMAPPQVSAASPYPSPFDYGWSYGEPPLRPGMPGSGTGRSS